MVQQSLTGNRKMKGFYWTLGAIMLVIETAIIKGIHFSGDNIIALGTLLVGLAGMFFTSNFGEHWSDAKKVSGLKKNIVLAKPEAK